MSSTFKNSPARPARRGSRWWGSALAAAALALAPGGARAQTYTWVSNTSGNLSDATRYVGGVAPPPGGSSSTVLQFFVAPTVTVTATDDLAGAFTLNQFQYYNNGSSPFTLAAATGNTLTFDGTTPGVTVLGNGGGSTGGTISAPVALNAQTTIGGPGLSNFQFTNTISGTGGLTIAGGAPTLNTRVITLGAANTFTGGVALAGGNLAVGNANALGATGSTLSVTGNSSLAATTTVTLAANVDIAAGSTLNLIGSSALTLGTASALTGSGNLVVRNSSSTALTIQSNSTFSGTVSTDISPLPGITASPGTITLSGNNGALTAVPTFNISSGGTLALSSNVAGSTANANRIGDAAAVNLRSSNFSLTGAAGGGALLENYGVLTGAGYSTVTAAVGTTAGPTTLAGQSLARADRGTFLFRGTTLGSATVANSGFITFAAAPTGLVGGGGAAGSTNISILPYAIGDTTASGTGTSFVTYDPVLGVRPLNTATEYATTLTTGVPEANVRLVTTGATANAAAVTVNSLIIPSGGSLTGTGTVTVTSGAVLNGSSTALANNLAFGGAEGQVFLTSSTTFSGALTGTNGLTKSGTSTLTLSGDNTGLTGPLTLNGGRVSFAAANNLPGTGQIVVNGIGALSTNQGVTYTGTTPVTVSRDVAINGGFFNPIANSSAGPLTFGGTISGPGGLYVITTGDVVLTGNNTYTGPTRLFSGNVVINSDANLGNGGGIDLGSGTTAGVVLNGNWTTSRNINLTSGFLNTNANTAVWNGPVTGTGSLTKSGSGTLQINSANPYSGAVTINAGGGTVRLAQNGALASTSYSLQSGTALTLDNAAGLTAAAPPGATTDRVSDGATVQLTAATLRMLGSGTQAATEFIGTVSPNGAGNVIEILSSGGQVTTLRIGNLNVGSAGLLVRGNNLGQTAGSIGRLFLNQFNTAAVTNGQILSNVTAENVDAPGVIDNAVYDTAVGVRLVQASDFTSGPLIQNAAPTNTPTNANFRVTTTTATADAANTIASLRLAPGSALDASSGTLTITSGNILTEAGASPASIAGGTLTAGTAILSVGTNSDLTVSSVIGGTGGLAKNGAGTLTLNTTPTNTGPLAVNAGALVLGAGVSPTVSALSGSGALSLGANTLTVSGAAPGTFSGTIAGSGGIVATGTGTLTLNGANTYTGGTTTSGSLTTNNAAGFGTGPISLSGAAQRQLTVNLPAGGTASFANPITATVTGANDFIVSVSGASAVVNLDGKVSGTFGDNFRATGTSSATPTVLRLTNAANDFVATNGVQVFEGVLAITSNAALGAATNSVDLNNSAGGGLRFDANNIDLARPVRATLSGAALLLNGNSATLSGVLSGTSTLAVNGPGALTLTNTANTISSAVAVNGGALFVNGNLPGATTPPALTVNTGGLLGGTGTIGATGTTRTVAVAAGGTVRGGTPGGTGTLTVTGNTSVAAATGTGGGRLQVEAARTGANAATASLLAVNGNLNFSGLATGAPTAADPKFVIDIVSSLSSPLVLGETYTTTLATATAIQRNGTAFTGTFDTNDYVLVSASFPAFTSQLNSSGTQLVLTFTPVPEPSSVLAVVAGGAGLAGWARRRRRQRGTTAAA